MSKFMKSCGEEPAIIDVNVKNYYSKPIAFKHDLYLTSEIGEAEDYATWLQIINNASENDVINVHINSPGGYLTTSIQLYSALVNSEATVVVSVEGECCSGATMVLMAADTVYVDNNAYFLFHSYSGGNIGKYNNLQENAKFQEKWFPNVTKDIYKDFLSEEEIETVLKGVDLWFDADTVIHRFEELTKKRQRALKDTNPEAYNMMLKTGMIVEEEKPAKKPAPKKPAPKKTEPKKPVSKPKPKSK